jgi:DNA-binding NarL/FixJ family response regulator
LIRRVLVADDYEPWRRQIDEVIRDHPQWQIAGEASNGFDAVAKARALAPDLILLDISLPGLNGIDAARQILTFAREARILFMSEHRSWDIISAAMLAGARGYIAKMEVGRDLMSAMEAIVDGRRVVSAALLEPVFMKTARERTRPDARRHEVGLYSDETMLLDAYARATASALEAGNGAVVVASGGRLEQIRDRLLARGIDADGAVREGRYFPADLDATLSTFTIDRHVDEGRFRTAATGLLMRTAGAVLGDRPRVTVIGDGTSTMLRNYGVDEALRLERLWDELSARYNLDLLCGYLTTELGHDEPSDARRRICAEHTAIHDR